MKLGGHFLALWIVVCGLPETRAFAPGRTPPWTFLNKAAGVATGGSSSLAGAVKPRRSIAPPKGNRLWRQENDKGEVNKLAVDVAVLDNKMDNLTNVVNEIKNDVKEIKNELQENKMYLIFNTILIVFVGMFSNDKLIDALFKKL